MTHHSYRDTVCADDIQPGDLVRRWPQEDSYKQMIVLCVSNSWNLALHRRALVFLDDHRVFNIAPLGEYRFKLVSRVRVL